MCTLVLLRNADADWPLVIAANRDEMAARPWLAPARHWPDRPEVVAGLDQTAGGTWLGLNDHGVVAAILNRVGTLGPQAGKRSRGELVLDALDFADAADAAESLAALDGRAYRPFNLMVADNRDAFWLRADGSARVAVHPIAPGLHMLSALDLDDPASPRIRAYRSRFAALAPPRPEDRDWGAWPRLLGDRGGTGSDGEEMPAMCFARADGFGTVSSSLIALGAPENPRPSAWLFAAGPPDRTAFHPVGAP